MKNIKLLSVCALTATGILVASCKKYLEQPALGKLSGAQVFTSSGLDGLLIGAYSALDGGGGDGGALGGGSAWESAGSNWVYGSVAGGDAHKGSDGTDQQSINAIAQWTVDASNGFLNTKWKAVYEGITRCNSVLSGLNTVSGISDADKKNLGGQAHFLRGHYYFELKKMFNNVPYIDENTTDFIVANDQDIWPKIEADFKFAYDNLPGQQGQIGRVNKWAAAAYLAKSYVYQKKWTDADALFTTIIASGTNSGGVAYGLTDNYEDNFNAATKNNKETVFAVQQAANDGTNTISEANNGDMLNFPYNSPFRCCGFFQPSMDLANSFRTDALGLPYVNDYNSHPLKTDQGVDGVSSGNSFTPDAGNVDPRLDWTVGRRGIPFLDWGLHPGKDWIREQSYAGPYSPKKNTYFQATQGTYSDQHSWAPGTANQINIIRFADVLLLAAETKAQLGQLDAAQTLVNRVRARAANPAGFVYTYKSNSDPMGGYTTTKAANYVVATWPAGTFTVLGKDGALKAIYFERKIEMGMEGQRFFDISRWGIAQQALAAYYTFDGGFITDIKGSSWTPNKNEYFPIPQPQRDIMSDGTTSKLKQNQGYN
ncbi:RagB/SusD family nutrient uptake outer membrane protein [Mucilaginibacter pedocola]|uniref:Carbohydrate-binding protein SusD n=1 Tax=Mucilaginibacter pedocola TaxID=1792845 RepID=A0A1S9PEI7_9SPHI|nr:RagB/SusD family nutrient uptake outer membrane protein [Mucilaginibacter pedocola]OOQ59367.1 carbohydrate-binding protein SusD [Mucilaginibacter pedocola]